MVAGAVSFFSFCASLFYTHMGSIPTDRLAEIAGYVASMSFNSHSPVLGLGLLCLYSFFNYFFSFVTK